MARRLGDILVADGYFSAEELQSAIHRKPAGVMLGQWLIQEGILSAERLGEALERQFDVGFADIDTATQNPQIVRLIPKPSPAVDVWWLSVSSGER